MMEKTNSPLTANILLSKTNLTLVLSYFSITFEIYECVGVVAENKIMSESMIYGLLYGVFTPFQCVRRRKYL